jgi:Protein of unknown function (DUF3071)
MQELRLVAVSEDGSYAVLAVPGRGGRFSLPIDDRLRTVARGQFSRLAQYEIEVESPLRPKEIQDRIRAGETADEIADVAGVPIERVRRFEGPVLAEREYRAQEAQRATVRAQGDSGPGPRLGDIVAERLAESGGSTDDVQWDSRKRPDGNWQVQLIFAIGGRPQIAEWVFDPQRRHATPADDQAARLCLPEPDWPAAPLTARGPASATVTPIGSRLSGAGAHHPEPERLTARGGSAHGAHPPAAASSAAPGPSAAAAASRSAAASRQATRASAAGSAGPPAGAAPAAPASSASARPPVSAGGPPAPAGGPPGSAAASAIEADGRPAAETAEDSAERVRPPARRAAGGRSRRASVPSWDEIMFGNSRQPD